MILVRLSSSDISDSSISGCTVKPRRVAWTFNSSIVIPLAELSLIVEALDTTRSSASVNSDSFIADDTVAEEKLACKVRDEGVSNETKSKPNNLALSATIAISGDSTFSTNESNSDFKTILNPAASAFSVKVSMVGLSSELFKN
ncbi:hypothetical protein WICMUC_001879 [Wickerhamomyces mucosus]|uniref:Uncharacterized protein n=1 Tax=Wickerhamomyces mucosus TaxID=1378264 RepID=A0A9P8PTH2_9ASCO|nr:hypothetical protein WICMUC_001879 [Wickerhamomyces mucosus]